MHIVIDPEFQALIPPLTGEEYADLTDNLMRDGCREPLSLWGNVLIDGHNRFVLCTKHDLPFKTVQISGLETRDDVKLWIGRNQLGRRNLSGFQRAELALMMKPIEEAKAKERMLSGKADPSENSHEGRTDETVAAMAGVSSNTLRKVEAIKETATPEIIQAARTGALSVNLAAQVADLPEDEQKAVSDAPVEQIREVARDVVKNYRAINSGENEWYTPAEYIEMARDVMGRIDLDPASCDEANKTVNAADYFTKDDDGLSKQWRGKLWINPPYSRDLMPAFVEKLKQSYLSGDVEEAILVSHNNTDTGWFHNLVSASSAICFPKKRIKFYRGEDIAAPTNGQAFFYLGRDHSKFLSVFSAAGFVVKPL